MKLSVTNDFEPHYLDIEMMSDPDFNPDKVMSGLYERLHLVLVKMSSDNIGISFPGFFGDSLGDTVRIHSNHDAIIDLMETDWMDDVDGQFCISKISPVPKDAAHRAVSRVQSKSSHERDRRRFIRRFGATQAEAESKIPSRSIENLNLPGLLMKSSSTQQKFRLFINHGLITTSPSGGSFNSYGLSKGATIAWF